MPESNQKLKYYEIHLRLTEDERQEIAALAAGERLKIPAYVKRAALLFRPETKNG